MWDEVTGLLTISAVGISALLTIAAIGGESVLPVVGIVVVVVVAGVCGLVSVAEARAKAVEAQAKLTRVVPQPALINWSRLDRNPSMVSLSSAAPQPMLHRSSIVVDHQLRPPRRVIGEVDSSPVDHELSLRQVAR
jgi:hypothetical protein